MKIFTSCSGCGEYLRYLGHRFNTHCDCDDPYQPAQDLENRFMAATRAGDDAEADRLAEAMDAPMRAPARLREAAHVYADWGWPVFPLRPGEKTPLTANGFHNATLDHHQIDQWWQRTPAANIGLPTGHAFDVIDIDFRVPHAWKAWVALKTTPGALPPIHGMVCTASAGLHLYIHATGDRNSADNAPGIDYRGNGGYVVAPPSRRTDGRDWEWSVRPSPFIKPHHHTSYIPEGSQ